MNPYQSPIVGSEPPPKPPRRWRLTSAEVFVMGAGAALMSLILLAPAIPHPEPYSMVERVFGMLTSNWLTASVYCCGMGALAIAATTRLRRRVS